MNITVVGAGISAYYFIDSLVRLDKALNLTWVYDTEINPSNNNQIIPIISRNGITKNNSELGDLLYDSFYLLKEEFIPLHEKCFKKSKQYFLVGDEDKFLRRHGVIQNINTPFGEKQGLFDESYMVDVSLLKSNIRKSLFKSKVRVYEKNDLVNSVEFIENTYQLRFLSGDQMVCNNLFFFDGFLGKFLPLNFKESVDLEKHQLNTGAVCQFRKDLGDESFIFSYEQSNLIYNSEKKVVQLSLPNDSNLKSLNKELNPFFDYIEVPEKYSIMKGMRDKGRKRLPHYIFEKGLETNFCRLSGMYKNGYTLGYYYSKKILKDFLD